MARTKLKAWQTNGSVGVIAITVQLQLPASLSTFSWKMGSKIGRVQGKGSSSLLPLPSSLLVLSSSHWKVPMSCTAHGHG